MNNISAFGYKIYCDDSIYVPLNKKAVIHTINQYSYCISMKDKEFSKALRQADILLPDGIGITRAVKFVYGKQVIKIAGADIHTYLLKELNEKKGKCFYLGASQTTLQQIQQKIKSEYPHVTINAYSPPYKTVFTNADNKAMINVINSFKPDILFVGMTAPKQEKWVETNKNLLDVNIICTIGAVFDFYAGTVQRAHPFFIKLGLEWLVRLVKEPKRMWRRYLYYGPVFLFNVIKFKQKQKKQIVNPSLN
jgi:N-acetylglucosaminyldiphosphoundecaprenol N-acetyl-beta-D-mannosaminyltransferase